MNKPKRSQKHRPEDDTFGFEDTSYLVLVFLLLFAGLDNHKHNHNWFPIREQLCF